MTNESIKNKVSRSLHLGIIKSICDEFATIATLSKRYNTAQYTSAINLQEIKERY